MSMVQELQRLREEYANEQQKREEKQIPQLVVVVNWYSCWCWDVLSHCKFLNLNDGKSWNVLEQLPCQDAEVREKMQRAKLEQLEIQRLGLSCWIWACCMLCHGQNLHREHRETLTTSPPGRITFGDEVGRSTSREGAYNPMFDQTWSVTESVV